MIEYIPARFKIGDEVAVCIPGSNLMFGRVHDVVTFEDPSRAISRTSHEYFVDVGGIIYKWVKDREIEFHAGPIFITTLEELELL